MTLVERCYDNIDAIKTDSSSQCDDDNGSTMSLLYADLAIDAWTCVLLRDVSLLSDALQSQQLALRISTLASKYLHCCLIVAPMTQHNSTR